MPTPDVSLREITKETLRSILRLKVAAAQEHFVASNAVSIAQAHFEEKAWFRAIYAGEEPVGFLMLLLEDPAAGKYYLWRLMIDERFQRGGYGRAAIAKLTEHLKGRPGAKELFLSHAQGEGNPAGFYQGLGFVYTGEVDEGELVMKLTL
jgi:diamine N-acetyltransferase